MDVFYRQLVPGQTTITGSFKNFRWTRYGRKLFGLPNPPRASRGIRRHRRQMKAAMRRIDQPGCPGHPGH